MNILLWVLQFALAFFCVSGALWRIMNYAQAAQDIPSVGALSAGMWNAIGAFEILGALGLVVPGLFRLKSLLTPLAAAALAVELLAVTALHVRYFGFELTATNPGCWSFGMALVAAFVAFGRYRLKPL